MLRIIEETVGQMDHAAAIRVRVGICEDPLQEVLLEHLFDRAVSACHTIRGSVTEPLAYYNENIHERQRFEEQLVADFERAVAEDEIVVYFQPQFHVRGEEQPVLASAEALVRWEHPQLGMLTPDQFIPIFERNGLIRRLDYHVWRQAARFMQSWKEKYDLLVPVSINISRVDLFDEELEERLIGLVREFGLSPGEFMLEITESAVIHDEKAMQTFLASMRKIGFSFALDDFGTGNANFSYVMKYPFRLLKIDKSFLWGAEKEASARAILDSMLELTQGIGRDAVVEGVETKAQRDYLVGRKVRYLQGYYYAKPIPEQDFLHFLENFNQKAQEEKRDGAQEQAR